MLQAVKIGNLTIDIPICLAPMAGTSSVVYRRICHEFGAGYCPTELSSARSVRFAGINKGFRYMRIDPEGEGITAIQLFGNDPVDFDYAIRAICEDDRLKDVSIIDINMGCPVPKVVKTGAGSALIKTPKLAGEIVKAAKAAGDEYGRPITVKTRTGYDSHGESSDLIKAVCDNGADMVCIHGRTRNQLYAGEANWDMLAELGSIVRGYNIPFFANGDIKDTVSAKNVIEQTECAGIMVGRYAMGNPWLFASLANELCGAHFDDSKPSDKQIVAMIMRHLTETCEIIDEDVAVKEFRSVLPQYIKGMHGAASLRNRLVRANTADEIRDILYNDFLGGDLK